MKLKSDMNVVPYIDVMLVLLVIFMVTAPLLVQGIVIELPRVDSEALPAASPSIITLSIAADGSSQWHHGGTLELVQFEHQAASLQDMARRIAGLVASAPHTEVFVRADTEAAYGLVVTAIGALQREGIERLGLVTEDP